MCFSIGSPKTINFPFVSNGKLMIIGVPIFKHIRVCYIKHALSAFALVVPLLKLVKLQWNFSGSNIFGTMKICTRQG